MVDPVLALSVFAVLCIAAAAVFWPRTGLMARLQKSSDPGDSVLLEDALKQLHLRERQGRAASLEDLAGKLEVSRARTAEILAVLVEGGLARTVDGSPGLTDEGRALARQTIRTHRLWERWLADRTGVRAEEWHDQAERMEHALTAEDADVLERRLGHPRYDPHGDPIPTSGGELPPLKGSSLTGVPAGTAVRIVHLEDEPREIFERLMGLGLAGGMSAEVVRSSDREITLRTPDGECTVDMVSAGHVTVEMLGDDARVEADRRTLADVPVGETVAVTGLSPACQGPQRRRLLDLGLVRGGTVTPELVSTSNDPIAYRIRGALIALRREQARWVSVSKEA